MKKYIFFLLYLVTVTTAAFSQNTRLSDYNSIGWYNHFLNCKLSAKFGLHAEYQWRRTNLITDWQQSLLRVGVNCNLNARVLFRVGYAWIETYPYGVYSINGLGRDFTEHRIYEMLQFTHKEGILDFSHRLMLEQRFVGRYSSASLNQEDEYPLLHRVRYMMRVQIPLKGKEIKDKTPYLAFYDEVFIGFGKNVNANIFDQNRFGALIGYRFTKYIRLEVGFMNQIAQLGRQVNKQSIFQYNNGLIVNTYFNIDVSKKMKP